MQRNKFKLGDKVRLPKADEYLWRYGFHQGPIYEVIKASIADLDGLYVRSETGELARLQSDDGGITGNGVNFELLGVTKKLTCD